ncbi:MAG: hypothetical protein K9L66_00295 [Spirochaetaceae bacterium]|nr:hypothetical protein [Spirochaetaceae bacterium]MCF7947185.1 hypothetical protein [Spirochaetia bacterium]MCF7950050.1 hypothetical protein [Spirochaetaceae bacterium]
MKIITIIVARPQFIKSTTVSRAIRRHNDLNSTIAKATSIDGIIVHTGQHFDDNMSGLFFSELAPHTPD